MADAPEQTQAPKKTSMYQLGVWVILILVGLSFGLMFGLDPQNITMGPQSLARVHGTPVVREDFTYQLSAVTRIMRIPQDERMQQLIGLREEVLDATVERLVLNEAAEELGLHNEARDAEMLTTDGHFIVLGDTVSWLGDRSFNYDVFQRGWLSALKVSEPKYLELQRQEALARTVRDVIAGSAVISDAELRSQYDASSNKISLRYVKFSNSGFAQLHDATDAEIEGYITKNKDALTEAYDRQIARFTKLPAQRRLRILKVNIPTGDGQNAASRAAASAARSRIDAARTRVVAGEDFRRVAREVSEDPNTFRSGGDFGWASLEGTGSGLDPAVDGAARTLTVGGVSDVIGGEDGLYLVQVVDQREGDVPKEIALKTLAEELVARAQGEALAKQAAQEALLSLKNGKKMAELFKSPDVLDKGGAGIEDLPMAGITSLAPPDDKPQIKVTGLFARDATVPGLGALPELTAAAWKSDATAEVLDQVFETSDGVVIAGVERRETGSDEGFAEQRAELYEQAQLAKQRKVGATWAKRRCLDARGRGELVPNDAPIRALLTYASAAGEEEPVPNLRPYQICDRVGSRGAMLRLGALQGGLGR
ncbi:MAG: peptidylprolyl isomerase [Nannocystaceae bacterium]